MSWIYERAGWPEFTWDEAGLARPLAGVRYRQGRHLGKMEALGFDLRTEANVLALTDEVVRSSAIEGEHLDPVEVRSSIARQIGLDVGALPMPGREVEGVVAMILDATRNCDRPLTAERLFGWHAALFPTGRSGMTRITVGAWRTDEAGPMRVVSGPMGKERLHFQGPAASRLADEMDRFLEWFESWSIDPVLRAGVAHFWFVTIHPFDDGNGRIGRAIAEMALSRADGTRERYYSMSSAIEARRGEYYRQLESGQRGNLDITAWLAWFLGCLDRTIQHADEQLASVLFKASLWDRINEQPVNHRQRTIINRLLGDFEGHLTTSKYASIAKCSNDTALRDIRELLARRIVVRNRAGGRSTSYRLHFPGERHVPRNNSVSTKLLERDESGADTEESRTPSAI
ncbi:MAG: Fic family protein [Spirochaetaceae bacterium]|nr:Fic family protein [Spirochaetaceae bacterium]